MIEKEPEREQNQSEDPLHQALEEAWRRLEEVDDKKAEEAMLLSQTSTADELETYLTLHADSMLPQEKFYLETIVQLRKLSPVNDKAARSMKAHEPTMRLLKDIQEENENRRKSNPKI